MGGVIWSCPHEETVGMVETFGKFARVAYPGYNCLNPCCGECVKGVVSLRVQQLDVTCETKTRDNVFVTVIVSTMFKVNVDQVYDAYYRLSNPSAQLSSYVFDVVRASVPKMTLDEVFLNKETIAKDIKDELTKSMSTFGFTIIAALVNDIAPANKVKDAMNDINASQRLRLAAMEKAEAAKVMVVKDAEADAEAKYLHGAGVARQRQAIIAGLRASVKEFASEVSGITSKDVLEIMLATQYFDTLDRVGSNDKSQLVLVNDTAADPVGDMRRALLEAGAAQHQQLPQTHPTVQTVRR